MEEGATTAFKLGELRPTPYEQKNFTQRGGLVLLT